MNRSDIIKALGESGVPNPEMVLEVLLDIIAAGLAQGEPVSIRNFGRFMPRPHEATVRINPKSREEIKVPPQIGVGFTPSQALRNRLNR